MKGMVRLSDEQVEVLREIVPKEGVLRDVKVIMENVI